MNSVLTISFTTDDLNAARKRMEDFSQLSAAEMYENVKNAVLSSDAVAFFNMTGGFMTGAKESHCMELLKNSSEEYSALLMECSSDNGKTKLTDVVHEGTCYRLDISAPLKKKLFLSNYCFYGHEDFVIELPELGTAFTAADDRSYEPYSFFFLSGIQAKMYVEHHTRTVLLM